VIDSMEVTHASYDLPYVAELTGNITGIDLEPGKTAVRIGVSNGLEETLSATAMQADLASKLRDRAVRVLAVGRRPNLRLLRMQEADKPWTTPPLEEAIFGKWDGLLRRLAK
jgi:hypothetical protein